MPGGECAALFESVTRHRGRPRVGHRLTGCSTVARRARLELSLAYLTFYLQNNIFWRADERTRTAYPCSLRVCCQWLLSVAGVCISRINRGFIVPWFAQYCSVLRPG